MRRRSTTEAAGGESHRVVGAQLRDWGIHHRQCGTSITGTVPPVLGERAHRPGEPRRPPNRLRPGPLGDRTRSSGQDVGDRVGGILASARRAPGTHRRRVAGHPAPRRTGDVPPRRRRCANAATGLRVPASNKCTGRVSIASTVISIGVWRPQQDLGVPVASGARRGPRETAEADSGSAPTLAGPEMLVRPGRE